MDLGFAGVWLFFVISGFCIHMRYARSAARGGAVTPDFWAFWKKRSVRLYPTYLVTVAIYVALNLGYDGVKLDWFYAYNVAAHLLMLHNLDPRTVKGICNVLWTLALEEQLYLAYFFLLPLRHRFGWGWTLGVCLASRVLTYAAAAVAKARLGVEVPSQALVTSQWFVWALGALAVEAYLGVVTLPRWCRDPKVAAVILVGEAVLGALDRYSPYSVFSKPFWLTQDPLLGLGFFIALNATVLKEPPPESEPRAHPVMRALANVGVFSYSLYLIHQVVILYGGRYLYDPLGVRFPVLYFLALPVLAVAVARVFFAVFEAPFLRIAAALPSGGEAPSRRPTPAERGRPAAPPELPSPRDRAEPALDPFA
jgi:peptidoglycan/LPS O-acetylase OafA/YrhL